MSFAVQLRVLPFLSHDIQVFDTLFVVICPGVVLSHLNLQDGKHDIPISPRYFPFHQKNKNKISKFIDYFQSANKLNVENA